jgi:hypothetical protein
VRPDRSQVWYDAERQAAEAADGTLDNFWQEYPETAEQALCARTLDKRLPPQWLEACYVPARPLDLCGAVALVLPDVPALPQLRVYKLPELGHCYTLGADPALGKPPKGGRDPDDSALCVLDDATGEQVAALAARLEDSAFGAIIAQVAAWYNDAAVMVERNNNGAAVILWLRENARATLSAPEGMHDDAATACAIAAGALGLPRYGWGLH